MSLLIGPSTLRAVVSPTSLLRSLDEETDPPADLSAAGVEASPDPSVVLVDADRTRAIRLLHLVAEHALPLPVLLTSAEAASDWLRRRPCDLCLIIDSVATQESVATLTELQQQYPLCPVILITGARFEPEAIIISAAGTPATIPVEGDVNQVVINLIAQLSQTPPSEGDPLTSDGLLAALHPPTYQNRLRVIGWTLDQIDAQTVGVWEVSGGFLVRALGPGQEWPAVMEFPDRHFLERIRRAIASRGQGTPAAVALNRLPGSYEDLFRAIGYLLDGEEVRGVMVTELDHALSVVAQNCQTPSNGTPAAMAWLFDAVDLASLLVEARSRRR